MRPLVAVVIPTFSQTIEQRISLGISEAFSEVDVDVLFAPVGYFPKPHLWHDSVLQPHRDIIALKPTLVIFYSGGLTYNTSSEVSQQVFAEYKGIPCIHMGVKIDDFPAVQVNNYQGMKDLISSILLKRTNLNIVFMNGPAENSESQMRQKALFDAYREKGFDTNDIRVLDSNFTSVHAQHTLREYWLQAPIKPNLIVCANDLMAKGSLDCLADLKVKCPDQCWVTGFDDFEYAQFMKPGLTTVHYPAQDMGLRTGRLALKMIKGEKTQDILVNTIPKFRGSTGHTSSDSNHMRERLMDLWQFIQERDATARKFSVVRQVHSQQDADAILDDIDFELDALSIDEMVIFKRDWHSSRDFSIIKKKQNIEFGKKDLSKHYWIFCPLETQLNNYGYALTRCDKHSAELVEFFCPQISEIHHRQVIQKKNDQLRTQNELSERMASLGRLVAGVAHEVNTPVGSGKLAASSLLNDLQHFKNNLKNDQVTRSDFDRFLLDTEEHAQLIYSSLDRAADLITNFKLVSVDQSIESTRSILLCEYINLVVSSLRHEFKSTNIVIETELDPEISTNTYPGIVAQLLTNILLNAKMHGFENGNVAGTIKISLIKDPTGFVLEVKDDGQGATEETIESIFEPFYTTARSKGGSGLGMYIVFNIASQKLKWDIAIESAPNEGFGISFRPKKESFA
jgi:DNA-binding LacI/PurR family transcriptional regulator/signal transduction histidine kinase